VQDNNDHHHSQQAINPELQDSLLSSTQSINLNRQYAFCRPISSRSCFPQAPVSEHIIVIIRCSRIDSDITAESALRKCLINRIVVSKPDLITAVNWYDVIFRVKKIRSEGLI
jgi:hypothetical protein